MTNKELIATLRTFASNHVRLAADRLEAADKAMNEIHNFVSQASGPIQCATHACHAYRVETGEIEPIDPKWGTEKCSECKKWFNEENPMCPECKRIDNDEE